MFEKRLSEIEARKAEIRSMLEGDGQDLDLDALNTELDALAGEEKGLRSKTDMLSKAAPGELRSIEKFEKKEERNDMIKFEGDTTIYDAPEYRSGYLKRLQGKALEEAELRALTTAEASAGAAVPTTTLNMIIDKLRQTSVLFPRITASYVPGNLSLAVANAKNAAAWKAEGTAGTPADDTVLEVSLTGFELIKLVEISAAASAMTISAFEAYIAAEIGRQMAIAIENAILNGAGAASNQPTGILEGISWVDGTNLVEYTNGSTVGYDNFMDAFGLLPTMYHNNAVLVMNRKMLFGQVRKIKDLEERPIFTYNAQDAAKNAVLGYPVIVDDYMPDGEILLGDLSYYYMNFAKSPEISVSDHAGFASGKRVYRGLAVADGKPALAEAFVKIGEAAL